MPVNNQTPRRAPRLTRTLSGALVAVLTVAGLGTVGQADATEPAQLVKPAATYAKPSGLATQNVASTSVELSWQPVSGAPGYRIRYVKGKTTRYAWSQVENFTLTGLKAKSTYVISIAVRSPTVGRTPAKTLSGYSKSIKFTTSNFAIPAPFNLTVGNQSSHGATVGWSAPSRFAAGMRYRVIYSKKASMAGASGVTTTANSVNLARLTSNSSYYVRVYVMNASGRRISDRSAYQIAKTRIIRGTINGTVAGVPGRDTQALAFTTGGDLVAQANVASNGSYSLRVRTGSYRVRISYLGTAGYGSAWVAWGKANGTTSRTASAIFRVASGEQTLTAPKVTLV